MTNGFRTSITPTSFRPGIRIPHDGDPALLQMSAFVTKDARQEGLPASRRGRLRLRQRARVHQGWAGELDQGLVLRRRRFPEGREPADGCGTTLTAPRTAVLTAGGGDQALRYRQGRRPDAEHHLARPQPDFKITGVIKDIPKNSSLKASAILRIDYNPSSPTPPTSSTCWGCQSGYVFLKLKPGTDVKRWKRNCPRGRSATSPTSPTATSATTPGDDQDWHFVNLKDVHLGKAQDAL